MRKTAIVIAVVVAMFATGAMAADTVWDGSSDSDWNTGANWDTDLVPTSSDDTFILNGGESVIDANAAASSLGIGRDGGDMSDVTPLGDGSDGTLTQTSGTLSLSGGRLYVGGNDNVGIYNLEGGTLSAGGIDAVIGFKNGGATAVSKIVQSGSSSATYKKMYLGDGWVMTDDSNSQGTYEMKGGTAEVNTYGLWLAHSARLGGSTGQKADFVQTGGTFTISGGHSQAALHLGAGTGSGGHAIASLEGGMFYNTGGGLFDFSQPADNNGVYVDIAGGTLRLDNADNGDSTWDYTALTSTWADSDFRAFGQEDPNADTGDGQYLEFTDDGSGYTDITAVPEPASLGLMALFAGVAYFIRRKRMS